MYITAKHELALSMIKILSAGKSTISEMAKITNRSISYLEQLTPALLHAGIIESIRGPGGGYCLAKDMADITVSEVLSLFQNKGKPQGIIFEAVSRMFANIPVKNLLED